MQQSEDKESFMRQPNAIIASALHRAIVYCDKLGRYLLFQRDAESSVYGWKEGQPSAASGRVDSSDPDLPAKAQPDPETRPNAR